jgi:hypothetical protein
VKFLEYGNTVHAPWKHFISGAVKNPYDKSVYEVGYLGEGKYKATINREMTSQYKVWRGMLQRCYDNKFHKKHPSYIGCTVSAEWHNFQIFGEWYDENYYEIKGERIHLDKDILIKGNKIYSPETCVFVPHRINSLFTKSDAIRGNLPIGVTKDKSSKYRATCCIKKQEYIGSFNTEQEAFHVYKQYKENYIKESAEEYKDKIPTRLYEVMKKYVVEIDD